MGRRPERLAGELREEIARMVAFELKDPRLGFITVTRVELASDLRYARVYVGVMGEEAERKKSLDALRSAAGFIRRELGRRLRIHHSPEVDFRYDKGLDATDRVARLLAEEADRENAAGTSQARADERSGNQGDSPDAGTAERGRDQGVGGPAGSGERGGDAAGREAGDDAARREAGGEGGGRGE